MDLNQIVELILGKGGVTVLLLLVVIGVYREWWYPAPYVKRLQERLDRMEAIVNRATGLAEKATDRVDQVVDVAANRLTTAVPQKDGDK